MFNPGAYKTDAAFDWLYPEWVQQLSKRHWTPIGIARKAAHFLADRPGARILDIGSGVGKFCLTGAQHFREAIFYGVEQRVELYECALMAKSAMQLENVHFLHANFTQLQLDNYDHFYFYNSFFENVDTDDRIDHFYHPSLRLYKYYTRYLFQALEQRPAGTRLVTYHHLEEIPMGYEMVDSSPDLLLRMYLKGRL